MNKSQELLFQNSCLNKARPDEPVFVLRANDPIAAQAIRHWATMAANAHDGDKIEGALQIANEFDDWRAGQKCTAPPPTPLGAGGCAGQGVQIGARLR